MIIQIEPWIDDTELHYLKKVVESRFVTEWKLTKEFEERFVALTASPFAVAYTNGTAGLFAAFKALGLPEGSKVAVPNLTFIATASSALFAGLIPVLVDVDPVSLCMTVEQAEAARVAHPDLRAILPVHLYGSASPMPELVEWSRGRDIRVVEDAAQGVGVRWDGRHVGTFGDFGVLSFYGNKTMTCGEGGVVLCATQARRDAVYQMKNHGRLQKGTFEHETLGFNFSFTEMQAAIGLAQMDKLEKIRARKAEIRELYRRHLPKVEFQQFPERCEPTHWFTSIYVDDIEGVAKAMLSEHQIQTRRFFYPLDRQPCLNGKVLRAGELAVSHRAYARGLSLPSSVTSSDAEIEQVCAALTRVLG
jgi:perosamine synthetase